MFLGVSGSLPGMDLSKEDRTALGLLVEGERRKRYGTKRAAYSAAGLNAATWDRIEAGEVVREDRLMNALDALWPEAQRDPRFVLTQEMPAGSGIRVPTKGPHVPTANDLRAVWDYMSELSDRLARVEQQLGEEGEDRDDTASIGDDESASVGNVRELPSAEPVRKAARRGRKQATDEPGDGS